MSDFEVEDAPPQGLKRRRYTMAVGMSNEDLHSEIQHILDTLEQPKAKITWPYGPQETASLIDHTLLKTDATPEQIDKLCEEARTYNFKTVCVRLNYVDQAVKALAGTFGKVACVIGFHEGTQSLEEKAKELLAAVDAGAAEADIVMNRSNLHAESDGKNSPDSNYVAIFNELCRLRELGPSPTILKLILETSQLSHDQIVAGTVLAHYAGFDFVKTSTGFEGRGASVDDVKLMRAAAHAAAATTPDRLPPQVKASGGIKTYDDLNKMVQAGAARIGASAGVAIVEEAKTGQTGMVSGEGGDTAY